MAQSKPSNLFAPANDERTGTNIKSGDPLLDGSRESRLDLILGATVQKEFRRSQNDELQPCADWKRS